MKKLFFTILTCVTSIPAFADNTYTNFQKFDKEIGFGLIFTQGNFSTLNSAKASNSYGTSSLNLEVEKLFDIGLWLDVNTSSVQSYTQTNKEAIAPLGANPFLATFNTKLGYNIPVQTDVALTPYIILGKNANLSNFTSMGGMAPTNQGITKDFFYTFGAGVRAEFLVNTYISIFLDQLFVYNSDQSNLHQNFNINYPIIDASNYQNTSTIGVKVNLWQNLQLASNLFYTNYNGYNQNTLDDMNENQGGLPTTAFGVQISAGFTF